MLRRATPAGQRAAAWRRPSTSCAWFTLSNRMTAREVHRDPRSLPSARLVPARIPPTVTADPTALEAPERAGRHAAARQSVLARSAIASFTRPTPIEFPILDGREASRQRTRAIRLRERTAQGWPARGSRHRARRVSRPLRRRRQRLAAVRRHPACGRTAISPCRHQARSRGTPGRRAATRWWG